MAAIKKFFEKRKLDVKFKKAGSGHKLTDNTRMVTGRESDARPSTSHRGQLTEEAQRAAEAALARMEQPRSGPSNSALKTQVRRELEAERKEIERAKQQAEAMAGPKEIVKDGAPMLSSVLFHCPDVGPAVLPRQDIDGYIEQFLLSQLIEEPEMTTALMILTLNKDKEKVQVCVDTLCKYISNILTNPEEEKFRKIRLNNKAFQSRVASLKGTDEFLQAAGFGLRKMPIDEGEEDFYVIDEEKAKDVERLQMLKDVLQAAEPIKPQLYRDTKVYQPASQSTAGKFTVPNDFYSITPEEMKREQQLRQEAADKFGVLRTKAMRERDELKELRRYRYALIRVRLPEGVLLQGTFRSNDSIHVVVEFVRDSLINEWIPFTLTTSTGQRVGGEDLTLAQLGLAPAALLNFAWDPDVLKEVAAQKGTVDMKVTLKAELLQTIQSL